MDELTPGQKAAQTRKRRQAGVKAALTKKHRAAGRKAAETRRNNEAQKEKIKAGANTANGAAPKDEPVLELGAEGGGTTIYRTPLSSGGWLFYESGSSMLIDEDMDEAWIPWTGKTYTTFEEALASILKNDWTFWVPISMHRDYRKPVRRLVQEAVRKLPEGRRESWRRYADRWQRMWQQEPRRRQGGIDLFGNSI
jgi:hypothetical protein